MASFCYRCRNRLFFNAPMKPRKPMLLVIVVKLTDHCRWAEPSAAMAGNSIVYDEVGKINTVCLFFSKAGVLVTPSLKFWQIVRF